MGDPFICNKCGAPRKYINQFCPNCESTGPHLPAPKDKKSRPGMPSFRRKPSENDIFIDDFEPQQRRMKKKEREHSDTFADEFKFARPRYARPDTGKEAKPAKEPRRERTSRPVKMEPVTAGDNEGSIDRKPSHMPFPGRNALYTTFFVLLGILIVLLVVNNGRSPDTLPTPGDTSAATGDNHPVEPAAANTPPATASNPVSSGTASNPTSPENPATPAATPQTTQDTKAPALAGSQPQVIADDASATLAWKTDEESKSTVKYGTTRSCDFYGPDEPGYKTNHSMFLSNLTPDTLYYYSITATDAAGNSGPVAEGSFRTDYQTNSAPYVGSRAPDFTLKTLDDREVALGQYRGKKVILNFWASWCTPCKVELPHIQEIWDKYRDSSEVTILTVAGSESDENEIRSYVASKGFTFPVCLDSTESTFNRYDLTSIPKTYFIDKNGVIRKVQLGMFTSPGEIEFMLSSY